MELYVGILVGILVSLLLKLNKALVVPGFSLGAFLKLNGISTIVNLILGIAAVYAKEDVSKLYPITFVSCIVLGAAGQFVWKGLFDSITPGVSTYLGLNDK